MAFPFSIRFVLLFGFGFCFCRRIRREKPLKYPVLLTLSLSFIFPIPRLNHMREIRLIFSFFAYFKAKREGARDGYEKKLRLGAGVWGNSWHYEERLGCLLFICWKENYNLKTFSHIKQKRKRNSTKLPLWDWHESTDASSRIYHF